MTKEATARGARLRAARERKGWTQAELAKAADVSQSAVSMIESGDRTKQRAETIHRLEAALGLAHGYLSGPEEPDPSLDEYLASPYAKDAAITDDEVQQLRAMSWKGAGEWASAAAWAHLLEALRKKGKHRTT